MEGSIEAYDFLKVEVYSPTTSVKDGDSDGAWEEEETKPLANLKKDNDFIKPKVKNENDVKTKKKRPNKVVKEKLPLWIECTLCLKNVLRHKFKLHMMVHNGEKPHLCDTCGKSFTFKFALVTHKRVHTGEKPYLCKECGQKFRSSSRFAEHKTIHTNKRPYVCECCALAFRTSGRLKRHLRIHTGEKPYKCSFCDRGFSESYNLKQHTRLHTGEKPPHGCSVCNATFTRRKLLMDHLKLKHDIKDEVQDYTATTINNSLTKFSINDSPSKDK